MKGIKAIIFDCDGTVLDSERIFINTWNIIGKPMGFDIPYDVLIDNRGKSKVYGRQNLLNAMGEDFPIDEIEAKRKVLNEQMFMEEENIVKPGMKELLAWMKEHHILSGVASARVSSVTTEHLKHAGIYEEFDVVIGGDMVEHNKPEPDLFLKAAELLSVKLEECVVIGDTISDMKAAKAAGMKAAFIEDLVPADMEVIALADVFLSRIDRIIPMIQKPDEKPWKISVQSARWYDEQHPEESMKYIKECGFEALDYSIDSLFRRTLDEERLTSLFDRSVPEIVEYYTPLKKSANEHGISIGQAHGPLVVYHKGNPEKTEYYLRITEKMIAACQFLECPAIVMHPWIGASMNAAKEEEIEVNLKIYRRLMVMAKKYRVKICLENLWDKKNGVFSDAPCIDAKEACWYIDKLNEEAGMEVFGFCLDIGHVLLYQSDILTFIKTLGKRLTILHLHENDGRHDSHLIPYTQMHADGTTTNVDWKCVLRALKDHGYEGTLSFETCNAITMLPCEVKKSALTLIGNIGQYFRTQLESFQ